MNNAGINWHVKIRIELGDKIEIRKGENYFDSKLKKVIIVNRVTPQRAFADGIMFDRNVANVEYGILDKFRIPDPHGYHYVLKGYHLKKPLHPLDKYK